MAASQALRTADVRPLLSLMGEIAELPKSTSLRRLHLLESLRQQLGASSAISGNVSADIADDKIRTLLSVGWQDTLHESVFQQFIKHQDPPDPLRAPCYRFTRARRGRPATCTREQLLHHRHWYASEHVQIIRRGTRSDHCLYSMFPLPGRERWEMLIFNRPWGDRTLFSRRDCQLLHLFHSALGWLYASETAAPDPLVAALSPRLRSVLDLLKLGMSEKMIAAHLRLSTHTIHDYLKSLYRHFNVSTRAELLAHWL